MVADPPRVEDGLSRGSLREAGEGRGQGPIPARCHEEVPDGGRSGEWCTMSTFSLLVMVMVVVVVIVAVCSCVYAYVCV